MNNKQATIYDVAEHAGVSIATVSRVLSGGSASRAARQKVEAAIAALDYTPPASRRGQEKGPENRTLALVVSNLSNPYYACLAAGAEEAARRNGYALQLYSHDLNEPVSPALINQLIEHRPAGAVLVGSMVENGTDDELFSHLERLHQVMPLAIIGPKIEGLDCINITSDLSLSVRKSIAHLIAMGHKRIAFIGGSSNIRSASVREQAFYHEMERLGMEVLRTGAESGFTPRDGEMCVARLFASLPEGKRPTALIAINDLVALGALRELHRLNLRVPEDVALIGCDNQFFTPYLNPPLTTVDLHPTDHGKNAVSELINAISGGNVYSFSHIRECSLIIRESCGMGRRIV
ncbi:MAG: LacI family DNA-binding transcriptional regulator [Clostridia bacterium]|nr:LacI family DNA-binding transcriptional regulator [Clostridia bacterium]